MEEEGGGGRPGPWKKAANHLCEKKTNQQHKRRGGKREKNLTSKGWFSTLKKGATKSIDSSYVTHKKGEKKN